MQKPKKKNCKKVLKAISIEEISGVNFPAQTPAVVTLLKRADDPVEDIIITEDLQKALDSTAVDLIKRYIDPADGAVSLGAVLNNNEQRKKYWENYEVVGPVIDALNTSLMSIAGDIDLTIEAKQTRMMTSITEFLTAMGPKWYLLAEAMQKFLTDEEFGSSKEGEDQMAKAKTVEELTSEIADLTKKLEDAQKNVQTEEAVKKAADDAEALKKANDELAKVTEELNFLKACSGMKDDEKAYMDSLKDEKMKKAFVDMKPEDRVKEIEKKAAADETVEVNGVTIRKSAVGEDQFKIFKATATLLAKQDEELKKERDARELVELKKKAEDEYSKLPGSTDEKAAFLKAAKTLPENQQTYLDQLLKAAQGALSVAFSKVGQNPADLKNLKKAGEEQGSAFNKKVAEIASRDNCSRTEALTKARKEYPDEFAEYQGSELAN